MTSVEVWGIVLAGVAAPPGWHLALVAGRAVNVWSFLLRRGEAPPGCHLARVDVDGSISAASCEQVSGT